MSVRVVLGEESYLVREGVERVIAAAPDLELAGSCGDMAVLRELIEALSPDVVVTDIRMSSSESDDGIALAAELRRTHPGTALVVLSRHSSSSSANALFADGAGGRAYVLQERISDGAELARIVRAVAAGGTYLDPGLIEVVFADPEAVQTERLRRLTPRENEVLALVAAGDTNVVISKKLGIGKRGVERHLRSIFDKLELNDPETVSRRVAAALVYHETR
jgi:prepilin-type processing-associated H-X9-DG protein